MKRNFIPTKRSYVLNGGGGRGGGGETAGHFNKRKLHQPQDETVLPEN